MPEDLLQLPQIVTEHQPLPSGGFPGLEKNQAPQPQPIPSSDDLQKYITADFNKNNNYKKTESLFEPVAKTPLDQMDVYNDSKIGYSAFSSYREREDAYSAKQTWYGNLGRNLLGFGAKAISTAVGDFDYASEFQILNGDEGGLKKDNFKNSLIEWADQVQKNNHVYETSYVEQHPYLSFINPFEFKSFTNRWGDVINNLGFTAGSIANALATDAVLTATTGIGEFGLLPAQGAKIIKGLFNAFKDKKELNIALDTAKTVKTLSTTNKVSNVLRQGLGLYNSALGEASVEGYQNFKDTKNKILQDYKDQYGVAPSSDEMKNIDEIARSSASATTWANTGLLMATNFLEFGSIFKPIAEVERSAISSMTAGKIIAKDIDNVVSKDLKNLTLLERTSNAVVKGLKNSESIPRVMLSEGFEEGAQFTISKKNEDYWSRKYFNTDEADQNWKSWMYGMHETFTTREGMENIIMGALSGPSIHGIRSVYNGIRSKISGVNLKDQKENALRNTIDVINSVGISGMFSDGYDGFATASSNSKLMQDALNRKDITSYKNFKMDQLFNKVHTALKTNHYDIVGEQLDLAKNLQGKNYQNLFGLEYNDKNKALTDKYIDEVKRKAESIKNTIDDVEGAFGKNPFNPTKDPHSFKAFNNYKEALAHSLVTIEDSNTRYNKVIDDVQHLAPSIDIESMQNLFTQEGIKDTHSKVKERIKELEEAEQNADSAPALKKIFTGEKRFLLKTLPDLEKLSENRDISSNTYKTVFTRMMDYYTRDYTGKTISTIPIHDKVFEKLFNSHSLFERAADAKEFYKALTSKQGFSNFKEKVADLIKNNFESRVKYDGNNLTILSQDELEKEKEQIALNSYKGLEDIKKDIIDKAAKRNVESTLSEEAIARLNEIKNKPADDLDVEEQEILFNYQNKIDQEAMRLNGEFDKDINIPALAKEIGFDAVEQMIRAKHSEPSFTKDIDISSISNLFGTMPYYLHTPELVKLFNEARRNPNLYGAFIQQTNLFDFLFNQSSLKPVEENNIDSLVSSVSAKNKKAFIKERIENMFKSAFGKKASSVYWMTSKELQDKIDSTKNAQYNVIGEKGLLPETIRYSLETARGLETKANLPEKYWEKYPMRSKDLVSDAHDEVYDKVMQIYTATGWQRGVDGLWRYDAGTQDYTFLPNIENNEFNKKEEYYTTLDKVLDSPSLYKVYPDLKDVKIAVVKPKIIKKRIYSNGEFKEVEFKTSGSWDNSKNRITIDATDDKFEQFQTLIHELQHVIQEKEGFAIGSSYADAEHRLLVDNDYLLEGEKYQTLINKFNENNRLFGKDTDTNSEIQRKINKLKFLIKEKFKVQNWEDLVHSVYEGAAGEVEARNVSYRNDLTEEERRQYLLSETEDVALEEKNMLFKTFRPVASQTLYSTNKSGILGFTSGNDIFLNSDALIGKSNNDVDGNTPIHEAGHLWMKWAKVNNPILYTKGMSLVEDSEYLNKVKADHFYQEEAAKYRTKKEKEDFYKDEALSRAIGDRGGEFLKESTKRDFKQWLTNLFNKIFEYLGIRGLSESEINSLTFNQFTKMVAADIISGQNVNDNSSTKTKTVDKGIAYSIKIENDNTTDDTSYSKISNSLYRGQSKKKAYLEAGGKRITQITGVNTIYAKIGKEYIPLAEAFKTNKITKENFKEVTGVDLKNMPDYIEKVNAYNALANSLFNSNKIEFTDEEVRNLIDVRPLLGNRDQVNSSEKATTLQDLKALGKDSYILSFRYTYDKKGNKSPNPTIFVIDKNGSSKLSPDHEIYDLVQQHMEMLKTQGNRYILVNRQPAGNFANTSFIFGRPKQVPESVTDDLVQAISDNDMEKTKSILDRLFVSDKSKQYKDNIDVMIALEEIRPSDRQKIVSLDILANALSSTRYMRDREIVIYADSFNFAIPNDEDAKFSDFMKTLTVAVKPNIYNNINLIVYPKSLTSVLQTNNEKVLVEQENNGNFALTYNNETLELSPDIDISKAKKVVQKYDEILDKLQKNKSITKESCK